MGIDGKFSLSVAPAGLMALVVFGVPVNRTCGFPASGFPTGFVTGSRQDALPSAMAQSRHTKLTEDCSHRERSCACGYLVASGEKVTHAVIDVCLDNPVRDVMRPWAEVATPSPHQAGQLRAHILPSSHVARHQDGTHLVLQTLHAFGRGTSAEIATSVSGGCDAVRSCTPGSRTGPFALHTVGSWSGSGSAPGASSCDPSTPAPLPRVRD
jgi:hypothetical protein